MKVILLQDIYKHGVAGEIVNVAPGFARNYLIPRGMAVKATKSQLKRTEKIREQVETRRAAYEQKLNELAREIDGVELIFGRRANNMGKLFGSVTTQEIADELMDKTGVDINRRRISQQPLREIGTHEVPVRLGTEESPILKITIVREEELAEFLAARERGEEVEPEAISEAEEPEPIPAPEDVGEMETEMIPRSEVQQAIDRAAEELPEVPAEDEEADKQE